MTDFELEDLSYSAQEEALSFGLSSELFLKYFKHIRDLTIERNTDDE